MTPDDTADPIAAPTRAEATNTLRLMNFMVVPFVEVTTTNQDSVPPEYAQDQVPGPGPTGQRSP